jgi:GntR family transcriptional regulator
VRSPSKDLKRPFYFSLSAQSGVPLYRQIMDQVLAAIATGTLAPGDQLPTVRQVAVDLAINLNTVLRAYRELEIRGVLDSQQGSGTFVAEQRNAPDTTERHRVLRELTSEFVARAGAYGLSAEDVADYLQEWLNKHHRRSD